MNNKRHIALKQFEDEQLNSLSFINIVDGEEVIEQFSFKELIERHISDDSFSAIYSELNLFFNKLSLYSLDSFMEAFSKNRQALVLIGHALYNKENKEIVAYSILNECGSLLELVRDELARHIISQEQQKIKPYIENQLHLIKNGLDCDGRVVIKSETELSKFNIYFFEHVKARFQFNKKNANEISKFNVNDADPRIIRKQIINVIENHLAL